MKKAVFIKSCAYFGCICGRISPVLLLFTLIFSGSLVAQANEDRLPLNLGNGFALGLHMGYELMNANIQPSALKSDTATTPDIYFAGLTFRYKYRFLYIRAGAEGGIAFPPATGKTDTGGDVTVSVTSVHAPITAALNLPLSRHSSLYMGFGYSHFIGIYNIKNDLSDSTLMVNTGGTHFLIGSEIKITDKANITIEWMHTFGLSPVLGDSTIRTRQLDLNSHRFMIGYAYYFVL